jgi:hypothetical protein
MNVKLFNTAPSPKEQFWQLVVIPTMTLLRSPEPSDAYTVVSFEWLFWSLTFIIGKQNDN